MYVCCECLVVTIICYCVLKLVLLMAYEIQVVNCSKLSLKILEEKSVTNELSGLIYVPSFSTFKNIRYFS